MRKTLLLAALGSLTLAWAQPPVPPQPGFEVAAVKVHRPENPNLPVRDFTLQYNADGVTFRGLNLIFLIGEAYSFPAGRIVVPPQIPKAVLSGSGDGYDIIAKASGPTTKDRLRVMLRTLLSERFRLTLHTETKTGAVYKLVVAKGGPKLGSPRQDGSFGVSGSPGELLFRSAEMHRLSGFLSDQVDRPVIDGTNLQGAWNFTLKRPGDLGQAAKPDGLSVDSPSAAAWSDPLSRLGLQLVPDKGSVDYLMIDSVQPPSEN